MENLIEEFGRLEPIARTLCALKTAEEKRNALLALPEVQTELTDAGVKLLIHKAISLRGAEAELALLALMVIKQFRYLFIYPQKHARKSMKQEYLRALLEQLITVDQFYYTLGGIVGYQVTILRLLLEKNSIKNNTTPFSRAPYIDVKNDKRKAQLATRAALLALPQQGILYPIGGLGDRLNLKDRFNLPLPVALLPFAGRSLLEGLIRDVESQEYLYYKIFGKELTTPIAMMTSEERGNYAHIFALLKKKKWFGRPKESFFLFTQPSVPSVTVDGTWSMRSPWILNSSPGGHGALWSVALVKGVFAWFLQQGRLHLLIRQINNPIAGCDDTLFTLIGIGEESGKAFGLASCQRLPSAAEGALVIIEQTEGDRSSYSLSNIEYTEFEQRVAIDEALLFPTNTNILYVDLLQLLPLIERNPLPGLMINMKSPLPYYTEEGEQKWEIGGRLESMMQNISEKLAAPSVEDLPTFVTYGERNKTISTTKKSYTPGMHLLETPEGAFYDLLTNAHELLLHFCAFNMPEHPSPEEFIAKGPSFLFLYHPALGPLYQVIAQKLRYGQLKPGAELQLEIAELDCEKLSLDGSLYIEAIRPMGETSTSRFSTSSGRCTLRNVSIKNRGIQREHTRFYWKNEIIHHERMSILLEGNAEFHAQDVTFIGTYTIHVPAGERWSVYADANGDMCWMKEYIEKPTWSWKYALDLEGMITLVREEYGRSNNLVQQRSDHTPI